MDASGDEVGERKTIWRDKDAGIWREKDVGFFEPLEFFFAECHLSKIGENKRVLRKTHLFIFFFTR